MFTRIHKILISGSGRDYGWDIEYNGKVIGQLVNCHFFEMFWDLYEIIPSKNTSLNNLEFKKLTFRNRGLRDETVSRAVWNRVSDNQIIIRGLYLLPSGIIEKSYVFLFGLFYDIRRSQKTKK
jgi:hypothetical protein